MIRRPAARRGFTLIELTIVIAIVGLLMTISAGAFVKYYLNARQRATETVIQIVDDQIMQRYESFWKKVNPPPLTRHAVIAGLAGPYVTNEAQPVRYRRQRLLAKLEAMRGDFPQQFADFLPGSAGGLATCTDTSTYTDNTVAVASRARAAIEAEYRRLTFEKNPTAVPNNAPRGTPGYNQITQIAMHDHQTESAACLYLILKVGSGEGRSFDMASIPPSHIVDTDDDGVPEIVDSWGTPLRFYRWPADLVHSMATISGQVGGAVNVLDAGNSNNQNSLDPERLLYSTEWVATAPGQTASTIFERNPTAGTAGMGNFFRLTDPNAGNRTPFSFPLYPVIISAGPDATPLSPEEKWQAFGLMWGANAATVPVAKINTSWPPYDHQHSRMGKISQEVSPTYSGAGAHVDNIYSRAMQAGREAQ